MFHSYRKERVDRWFHQLQRPPNDEEEEKTRKLPNAEQVALLRDVSNSMQKEAAEESKAKPATEFLRELVPGKPDVGKGQLINWVRAFFEKVLHWNHGVEFVILATQNTMVVLVAGVALHSFGQ